MHLIPQSPHQLINLYEVYFWPGQIHNQNHHKLYYIAAHGYLRKLFRLQRLFLTQLFLTLVCFPFWGEVHERYMACSYAEAGK